MELYWLHSPISVQLELSTLYTLTFDLLEITLFIKSTMLKSLFLG